MAPKFCKTPSRENEYFRVVRDINKTLCLQCEQYLSGVNVSNIKRHYRLVHKKYIFSESKQTNGIEDKCTPAKKQKRMHIEKIFIKSEPKGSDDECVPAVKAQKDVDVLKIDIDKSQFLSKAEDVLQIDIDKSKFLKCCVGLVTVKNLPLTIFDDKEFFKVLISPYEKKFHTHLNSKSMVSFLESSCVKIQQIITNRVKNRMLSVSFDVTTGMGKNILGINIQYIKDFEIYTNTLGMIRLQKRHNASYLKEEILKCLKTYQIDIRQVYCSTTDNGANLNIGEEQSDGDNSDAEDNNDSIYKILSSVLPVVRCGAYIIHLSAYDVLKELTHQINECRDAVKLIRKTIKLGNIHIQMPVLDNSAWWSSTYEMFLSLLEIRHHTEELCNDKNVVPEIDWEFVKNFVAAFKPLAFYMKQIQKNQYVIGDFYRDWLCCEIELEELLSITPYASLLHKSMQIRKKQLLQNSAFLAALYLDPRFNFKDSTILTEEQRSAAIEHLDKSFDVLKTFISRSPNKLHSTSHSPDIQTEYPTTSALAKLEQRILQSAQNSPEIVKKPCTFKRSLMFLTNQEKLPLDVDILNYWKTNEDSDINKIVEVALSVPVRQESMERAFNVLPIVCNKSNINNKTLSNLLMVKLNFKELNDH